MRLPWQAPAHSDAEAKAAEGRFTAARAHLSILLRELEQTLARIEDKRRRGFP